MNAAEALAALKAGNARFLGGKPAARDHRERISAQAQKPFAVIIGCADSRVPVEIVFDQSLGDLFVIRVAGSIVTPIGLGSVEFAAEQLGARLVVVLGHSHCGAVQASIDALQNDQAVSPNLKPVLDRIGTAVAPLLDKQSSLLHKQSQDDLLSAAVHANIMEGVAAVVRDSELLARLVKEDGLVVTGAVYSLESGAVAFLPS
ncbi:MAG: carbonic anhydrase [Pseudomonadales bacterium]